MKTDLDYAKEMLASTRDWIDTAEAAKQPTDPGSQSALQMAVACLLIATEHLESYLRPPKTPWPMSAK